jgi:hypothetical protein
MNESEWVSESELSRMIRFIVTLTDNSKTDAREVILSAPYTVLYIRCSRHLAIQVVVLSKQAFCSLHQIE